MNEAIHNSQNNGENVVPLMDERAVASVLTGMSQSRSYAAEK